MNVFISADDKFILPAKVTLTSFLVNNPQEFHHVFLHSGVRDENIEALCTLVGSCFVGSLLLKNLQKRPAVRHRLPDGAKLPPGADCYFYSSSACPV